MRISEADTEGMQCGVLHTEMKAGQKIQSNAKVAVASQQCRLRFITKITFAPRLYLSREILEMEQRSRTGYADSYQMKRCTS